MSILTPTEKTRYQRHLILKDIGEEGQQRIKDTSVLVVGAGGLGCPVMQYLGATGVGRMGIMDDDIIDISNLQRQVFYGFSDVGKLKAIVAKKKLETMNGLVDIDLLATRFNPDNARSVTRDYDLVIDCTDNLATRLLINDACIIEDKVMIHGAVHQYDGQVSVFNYQGGPSYRCLYPFLKEEEEKIPDSGIFSVIPGIIGTLQANEALKVMTGIGQVLSGKILTYLSRTNEFFESHLVPIEHNLKREHILTITKTR